MRHHRTSHSVVAAPKGPVWCVLKLFFEMSKMEVFRFPNFVALTQFAMRCLFGTSKHVAESDQKQNKPSKNITQVSYFPKLLTVWEKIAWVLRTKLHNLHVFEVSALQISLSWHQLEVYTGIRHNINHTEHPTSKVSRPCSSVNLWLCSRGPKVQVLE